MKERLSNTVYEVPKEWRGNKIYKLYNSVLNNSLEAGFNIYDFNMLFNDEKTKELIRTGATIGCFYIESPGMRSLLRRLNVETFEMLTAASSIIRPGVAESGMMQEFIERHKNPAKRIHLLPQIGELLADTYGVMIYQEDVIKVAHYVAGLSLEEADLLRRAMSGKMRSHDAMQKIYDKFMASCSKKGFAEQLSLELWRQIESFAGYSFCKAHSASFALLSFQVAYLKAHYPAEFMACVLNNGGGFYHPAVYVWECKRLGIKLELPCINHSNYEYSGCGNKIRMGLMAVKNLSRNTIDTIVEERESNGEYSSLGDFLIRTKTGFEETQLLIKCGAMGCFKKTRPDLLKLLDLYIKRRRINEDGYYDLFMNETFALEEQIVTGKRQSVYEICKAEYESFDFMVTRHPLYFFPEYLNSDKIITSIDMPAFKGKNIKMLGWFISSKRIRTKKGDIMKFLSLEDLNGTYEAILFPKSYNKYVEMTLSMGPYLVEGKVDINDQRNLIVEKLEVLSSLNIIGAFQKDSVENNYFGDVEKVEEDEFNIVEILGKEKLLKAYAS